MDEARMAEMAERALTPPQDFAYFGELYEADGWGRMFGVHRDSDALERSNWQAILERFKPFSEEEAGEDFTWTVEGSSHWAVGWIDQGRIRVRIDGEYTEAFKRACEIVEALENYPVLNEEEFSRIEWEDDHPDADERCYSDDPDCGCGRKAA